MCLYYNEELYHCLMNTNAQTDLFHAVMILLPPAFKQCPSVFSFISTICTDCIYRGWLGTTRGRVFVSQYDGIYY